MVYIDGIGLEQRGTRDNGTAKAREYKRNALNAPESAVIVVCDKDKLISIAAYVHVPM